MLLALYSSQTSIWIDERQLASSTRLFPHSSWKEKKRKAKRAAFSFLYNHPVDTAEPWPVK